MVQTVRMSVQLRIVRGSNKQCGGGGGWGTGVAFSSSYCNAQASRGFGGARPPYSSYAAAVAEPAPSPRTVSLTTYIYIYMRIAVRKPTCTIGYGISLRGCSVLRRCDHMGDNEGNAARAANVASRGRGRADAHLRRMGLYRGERRYGKQAQ